MFPARQREAKLEGYMQTLATFSTRLWIHGDGCGSRYSLSARTPTARRGGHPLYPREVLARMVFLQGLYNQSDEQCEHQVLDRLSFQRFCRLDGALNIPDARMIWSFRQRLAQGGLGRRAIFESLSRQLQRHCFIPRGGQIVDASIVAAPITQANTAKREALNRGKTPEGWSHKRIADTHGDACWTKTHGKSHCGYKLHANADARYKLIRTLKITAANADDGQQLPDVLQAAKTRDRLLADRGYDEGCDVAKVQSDTEPEGLRTRSRHPLTLDCVVDDQRLPFGAADLAS